MRPIDTKSEVKSLFHYHEPDDTFAIERVQDIEPYLEMNKAKYNSAPETGRFKGNMREVAEIPLVIVEKWLNEGINIFDPKDAEKIKRKLNSSEYRYLRTCPGKI